jgi:hypothetical protein
VQQVIPFDPGFHRTGSVAASGHCSQHGVRSCSEEPIISFIDQHSRRQSGCQRAMDELIAREEITVSSTLGRED